jgi:hypothetical protein
MVANTRFAQIHLRTVEIFRRENSQINTFANLNILTTGDLLQVGRFLLDLLKILFNYIYLQLKPVKDSYIFQTLTTIEKQMQFLSLPLEFNFWEEFEFIQLKQNMRQIDDPEFAQLLDRVRYGVPTLADISLLNSRTIPIINDITPFMEYIDPNKLIQLNVNMIKICSAAGQYFKCMEQFPDILCLFPRNDDAEMFNAILTNMNKIKTENLYAIDSINSSITNKTQNKTKRNKKATVNKIPVKKTHETAGLETKLCLGINSKVMLRRNLNVSLGLVNGAIGTITGFLRKNDSNEIQKIRIKFHNVEEEQFIERFVADYEQQKGQYVSRSQFPLSLAWAISIHKSQGLSLSSVMIDIGSSIFEPAMAYVALSRAKVLSRVFIIEFEPTALACNSYAVSEYYRLSKLIDNNCPAPVFNILPTNIDTSQSKFHTHENTTLQVESNQNTNSNSANKTKLNTINVGFAELKKLKSNERKAKINEKKRNVVSDNQSITVVTANSMLPDNYPNLDYFRSYPIKITNVDNSCYANVILQILLNLGVCFYNAVQASFSTVQHNFAQVYTQYFLKYSTTNSICDSIQFRRYVADCPPPSVAHEYLNGTQKTSFLFMFRFLARSPNNIKSLFHFKHHITKVCLCGHKIDEVNNARHYSINLDLNSSLTKFYSAFNCDVKSECLSCGKDEKHHFTHRFSFPNECRFVILTVKLFRSDYLNKKINSKFIEYDPEQIFLPLETATNNQKFKILAIVVRLGDNSNSGHYIVWTRSITDNTWWRISDDTSKNYKVLPNNLNSIEQIYLYKL